MPKELRSASREQEARGRPQPTAGQRGVWATAHPRSWLGHSRTLRETHPDCGLRTPSPDTGVMQAH